MDKPRYLLFKKVYIELKILIEKAKKWESTTKEDLEQLLESEERLDEHFNKLSSENHE